LLKQQFEFCGVLFHKILIELSTMLRGETHMQLHLIKAGNTIAFHSQYVDYQIKIPYNCSVRNEVSQTIDMEHKNQ